MSEKKINPVKANAKDVIRIYGEASEIYSYLEEIFEKNIRKKAVKLLNPRSGERILDIGFGTGCSLVQIANSMDRKGKIYGIDITREMIDLAKNRVEKEKLAKKVKLIQADARKTPFKTSQFDAIYIAFTLELFNTSDIRTVLQEIRRILKQDGRLGLVSMSREDYEDSKFVKAYEWFHKKFPKRIDCRPIYVKETLEKAGYSIKETKEMKILGLCPVLIALAKPNR